MNLIYNIFLYIYINMDNDTILELKELLKNIDYFEINLSNQFNNNNKQLLTLKNNINDINELYHILCKQIF
jgi:hypothetical protein